MITKAYLLAVIIIFISCSNSGDLNDYEQDKNILNKEKPVNDSLLIQRNDEILIPKNNSEKIDLLIFKEGCTILKEGNMNTNNKAIFNEYFSTPQLLNFKIASFCKDSVDASEKSKCLDYLNGKQQVLKFNYLDSVTALNCFTNFYSEFRNTKRKVDSFFCLKPGFIVILEGNKISFILINDCSERGLFNLVKEYVKANVPQSNYLISRCGLNIEK